MAIWSRHGSMVDGYHLVRYCSATVFRVRFPHPLIVYREDRSEMGNYAYIYWVVRGSDDN